MTIDWAFRSICCTCVTEGINGKSFSGDREVYSDGKEENVQYLRLQYIKS